ncbi:hypothetical protein NLX71_01625 [Paenibacillus sp. MZ04-78.2]|uniref:hypothetical protein n=1 Tax=Paenibacillus sp. MZ04-78.2 TaxID=2962034 RepID=UPI0020B71D3A|nr:hypothetical protein [Paenibacillus sp. MZ04-78.2]MCP3772020.1 hypothetical protein [Paenibacillus sp. MZ04-78.2]
MFHLEFLHHPVDLTSNTDRRYIVTQYVFRQCRRRSLQVSRLGIAEIVPAGGQFAYWVYNKVKFWPKAEMTASSQLEKELFVNKVIDRLSSQR